MTAGMPRREEDSRTGKALRKIKYKLCDSNNINNY